jgi:hypothetical protein
MVRVPSEILDSDNDTWSQLQTDILDNDDDTWSQLQLTFWTLMMIYGHSND